MGHIALVESRISQYYYIKRVSHRFLVYILENRPLKKGKKSVKSEVAKNLGYNFTLGTYTLIKIFVPKVFYNLGEKISTISDHLAINIFQM